MAGRTFAQARAEILQYLGSQGWHLSGPLKVPWAESPRRGLRLWFKAQAVYASEGSYHTLGGARSTWIDDIRRLDGPQFLEAVRRMYGAAADRRRSRISRWR